MQTASQNFELPGQGVSPIANASNARSVPGMMVSARNGTGETCSTPQLLPYQWAGVLFLLSRPSALLADEMGLGKTAQTLVALQILVNEGQVRRALLVAPKSLLTNWQRELARWAPQVRTQIIGGTAQQRRWLWQHSQATLRLVHYEILAHDARLLTELVTRGNLHFDLIILDEAQRVKNAQSVGSKVLQQLPRRRLWALTGTPLENCLAELCGVFTLIRPGLLQPEMPLTQVRAAIAPYVLRRTKEMVAKELPPKIYRDCVLELTAEQSARYRETLLRARKTIESADADSLLRHVFVQILRLKQICNFDPVTGRSAKAEQLRYELSSVVDKGQKAIIFSQFVGTLFRLQALLAPWQPLVFYGGMSREEREATIAEFRDNPQRPLLLLSYRAGGVGLNLQFASYVFLFDRWWNPAVEDQAINRVHRLGSTAPVVVTRYTVADTIEERIEKLLRRKRILFDQIFSSDNRLSKLGLSREEWLSLFELELLAEAGRRAA